MNETDEIIAREIGRREGIEAAAAKLDEIAGKFDDSADYYANGALGGDRKQADYYEGIARFARAWSKTVRGLGSAPLSTPEKSDE